MPDWSLEQDAAGRGLVKHHAAPRFVACWTSGGEVLPAPDAGPCWRDAGSGDGDDSFCLFAFRWIDDAPPNHVAFEHLMQEAAKVIDAWITSHL